MSTTARCNNSTAGQIAGMLGLDYSVANVQIDGVQSPADMAKALARLEALAKERGCAIGVASAKASDHQAARRMGAESSRARASCSCR